MVQPPLAAPAPGTSGGTLRTFPGNEFVVGYGLDYRERYRNLRAIGTLAPHVYS